MQHRKFHPFRVAMTMMVRFEDNHVRLEQNDKRGGLVAIALDEIEKANLEEEF